jgi:signal transduction histidine kinase
MDTTSYVLIFFFYGLAFFVMGLAVLLERGHGSNARLRVALGPLAAFGLIHGSHEWLEMFDRLEILPWAIPGHNAWELLRIALLTVSFLTLGMFGATLLDRPRAAPRLRWVESLALSVLWLLGSFVLLGRLGVSVAFWDAVDVWSRYMLAVPAAVLAAAGLLHQRREFVRAGLPQFGLDCAMAALAFLIYGLVGQTFPRLSVLPPSTVINSDLFQAVFGFPVQLLRAGMAILASYFVMRFLRSFEVEQRAEIARLQQAQLREAEAREALRIEMMRRNVGAQEAERQRIARELHDETGQALTALGLGLRGIESALASDPSRAQQNVRQLESLVTRSLDELQRLIADLRPSHLDDLGLPAALRWYAGEVQTRSQLPVSVEIRGDPRPLSGAVNTALFRMAQEALTNAVKHAHARQAVLHLRYGEQAVALTVEDDGVGFDTARRARLGAWGLMGMEERAHLLGGDVRIESTCGNGTRVEAVFPYPAETKESNGHPTAAGG